MNDGVPRERNLEEAYFLVDAFNFAHAVVVSREERSRFAPDVVRARLMALFAALPLRGLLVIDDRRVPFPTADALRRLVDATPPPDSFLALPTPDADRTLLDLVAVTPHPERLVLVTADRSLADRARLRGAGVTSPFRFADAHFDGPPRDGTKWRELSAH